MKPKHILRVLALAVTLAHGMCLSQPRLDASGDRERQLIEQITQKESRNGPNSERLIDPLTSLARLYQEEGDRRLAVTAMERLRQIVRANYGLYSLEQAPLIRQLMRNAEAIGDIGAAWKLEQELLTLARRNSEDMRSASILSEAGDRRMDVLDRYLGGEMPSEIILGCYCDWTARQDGNCISGSRQEAVRALVSDA